MCLKQECEGANSGDNRTEMNVKLMEKLKASESLCDELMEENEALKADIKDLQQEIEEMQVSVFYYSIIISNSIQISSVKKFLI